MSGRILTWHAPAHAGRILAEDARCQFLSRRKKPRGSALVQEPTARRLPSGLDATAKVGPASFKTKNSLPVSRSQTRTPSSLAPASCFPVGSNASCTTGAVLPFKLDSCSPVLASNTETVSSGPVAASCFPSGLNATAILLDCPIGSSRIWRCLFRSHTRAVPSWLAVTSRAPSVVEHGQGITFEAGVHQELGGVVTQGHSATIWLALISS